MISPNDAKGKPAMAYRKILSVLTGADSDAAALATAFSLVAPTKGNVSALFLRHDPRDAMPMIGEGMTGSMIQDVMKSLDEENTIRGNLAYQHFKATCAAAGASECARAPGLDTVSACWQEVDGVTEDVLTAATRVSDAAIFPPLSKELRTAVLAGMEAVLLEGGRPVIVSAANPPATLGRKVAIAWNGRVQASRAVALAMPVLQTAEEVHILTAGTTKTDVEGGKALQEYLAWHGIPAAHHRLNAKGMTVAACIQAQCREVGADLLVMGGYGHSRLRELILGGVTKDMLDQSELTLLMAH
jgi:nucleotide-binding universal stress UspA family protein